MEPSQSQILAAAPEPGEQRGWNTVLLHDIARTAGATLVDIRRQFPDKDALTQAWLDLADGALLKAFERPVWDGCSPWQRLHHALFAWLEALVPHRTLMAEMLRYNVQPEHLHLQASGVMRVNRTVQWIRAVAMLPAVGWWREAEEAVLIATYLTALAPWFIVALSSM